MADGDPEKIVFMKHVNEIKLYSSFKCSSDYREPGITQDNQFEGRVISLLG